LVRSSGGTKLGLLGRKKEERERGDARILGSGNFVTDALACAAEVARSLSISRVNAGRCAERGKKVLDNYEALKDIVQ